MKEKIEETLKGLKDFQAKTVDYVFEQLYVKGRSKMLIADEVGLGKTIELKESLQRPLANLYKNLQKRFLMSSISAQTRLWLNRI